MKSISRRSFLRRGAGLLGLATAVGLGRHAQAGGDWYPWGMDVSHWQGAINWDVVAAAGITFAFIKSTEGTTYRDPTFDFNWSEMARVGIFRGAYHFGHPGIDATAQARFFASRVNPVSYDLLLCLDLEVTDNRTPAQVWSWTQSFVAETQRQTGTSPIIYTSPYFWTSRVGNPTDNLGCPLWIAHWNVSWPTVPRAWPDWTFWQYSSTGSVPGISGRVDQDTFNGPSSDLWLYTYP